MAPTPAFLAWLAHLFQLPAEVDEIQVRQLRMESTMAKYEDEMARVNAATDALAAKVAELRNMVNSDDPEVERALNDLESRLRGIAADPAQPVPVEPEPTPDPEQPVEPAPVEGDQPA